jgi:histidinol-phosphate phosphatase family protein
VEVLEDRIRESFLLLYGDIMLDMKLDDFIAFHQAREATATLAVHPNDHPYDSDLVVLSESDQITGFIPRDKKPTYYANLVTAAVYMLTPSVFRYIPKDRPSDFVRDVFPAMLNAGESLYGYRTTEYIKDMGTADRFERVSRDLSSGKITRCSKAYKRPAIFMDRDGTMVEEVNLLHRIEDLHLYPFSAAAVRKINQSDFLSFIITNQPVVARNLCDMETVSKIHRKLETLLGEERAYIDRIYFCPHHPDRGYPEENRDYKVDCSCRKPKTGMIEEARRAYSIDLQSSWFIGDTTVDIQTGINAGLQTILLRTGIGGKDGKYPCRADFKFDNLDEAVRFILADRHSYGRQIEKIFQEFDTIKNQTPFVIAVGGQSRSGKSTFVKLLTQFLRRRGIASKTLSLDNWLVGIDERSDNMNVRERYRYDDIGQDVMRLVRGEKISLNNYDPYQRTTSTGGSFSLDGFSCLIIEGVPALDIESLRSLCSLRIYTNISEDVRKKRFFSFYRWKNIPEEEIVILYQSRRVDEFPIIDESKQHAHIIVRLEDT